MRLTWKAVPDELRSAAKPLLDKHRHLTPDWVRSLAVHYDDEMVDAYATVASEQRYKRVTLTIGSGWLSCDAHEREWIVVHELVHTLLAPLEKAWEDVLAELPKSRRAAAEKRFEDALEESVSGVAYALVREST